MTKVRRPVEYDATGRMIRDWDPPVPPKKPRKLCPLLVEDSSSTQKLREAEKNVNRALRRFENTGLNMSSHLLRHYIEGSGRATVHIDGEIYHTIKDKYDFNDDTIYDKNLFKNERFLAEQGKARPFDVYGHRAQKITGKLDLQNGTIRARTFKWQDLDD